MVAAARLARALCGASAGAACVSLAHAAQRRRRGAEFAQIGGGPRPLVLGDLNGFARHRRACVPHFPFSGSLGGGGGDLGRRPSACAAAVSSCLARVDRVHRIDRVRRRASAPPPRGLLEQTGNTGASEGVGVRRPALPRPEVLQFGVAPACCQTDVPARLAVQHEGVLVGDCTQQPRCARGPTEARRFSAGGLEAGGQASTRAHSRPSTVSGRVRVGSSGAGGEDRSAFGARRLRERREGGVRPSASRRARQSRHDGYRLCGSPGWELLLDRATMRRRR